MELPPSPSTNNNNNDKTASIMPPSPTTTNGLTRRDVEAEHLAAPCSPARTIRSQSASIHSTTPPLYSVEDPDQPPNYWEESNYSRPVLVTTAFTLKPPHYHGSGSGLRSHDSEESRYQAYWLGLEMGSGVRYPPPALALRRRRRRRAGTSNVRQCVAIGAVITVVLVIAFAVKGKFETERHHANGGY